MVNIVEMSKENYIAWRAEKVGMSVEDITKLYNEYAEEGKLIQAPDVDLYVKKRFGQAFIKKDKGFNKKPAVPVEVIIIGINKSDYGASTQYAESMAVLEQGDEDTIQEAITQGLLNEERKPIFHFANKANKKNGQVIDVSKEMQYSLTVVAKRTDKESEFLRGTLSINAQKVTNLPEIGSLYLTEAVVGTSNVEGRISLYGDDRTVFSNGTKLSEAQIDSLFDHFFKDILFPMASLEDVAKNYPIPDTNIYNKYVLTKACVASLNLTKEGYSNKVLLADGLDEEAFADSWVPEEITINFNEQAQDLWVFGTVLMNEKEAMPVINIQGIVVPERFIIKEQPKPIEQPKNTEETSVQSSKQETPKVEAPKGGFTF